MVSISFILHFVLLFCALITFEAKDVKYHKEVLEFLREVHELDRMIDGELKRPTIEIEPPGHTTNMYHRASKIRRMYVIVVRAWMAWW